VRQLVSSTQRPVGILTTDDIEIANALNSFFGSVFTNKHLTPIFKKGCRTLPKNYHPISLTSKMLESNTKEHIMNFQRTIYFVIVNMAFDLDACVLLNCLL